MWSHVWSACICVTSSFICAYCCWIIIIGAQILDQRKSLSILKYLIYLPWHWDFKWLLLNKQINRFGFKRKVKQSHCTPYSIYYDVEAFCRSFGRCRTVSNSLMISLHYEDIKLFQRRDKKYSHANDTLMTNSLKLYCIWCSTFEPNWFYANYQWLNGD